MARGSGPRTLQMCVQRLRHSERSLPLGRDGIWAACGRICRGAASGNVRDWECWTVLQHSHPETLYTASELPCGSRSTQQGRVRKGWQRGPRRRTEQALMQQDAGCGGLSRDCPSDTSTLSSQAPGRNSATCWWPGHAHGRMTEAVPAGWMLKIALDLSRARCKALKAVPSQRQQGYRIGRGRCGASPASISAAACRARCTAACRCRCDCCSSRCWSAVVWRAGREETTG